MTTDALAALARKWVREYDDALLPTEVYHFARWLAPRVIEVPPDHPLRTGEPSEVVKLAFIKAHTAAEGEWLPSEKWEEALDAGLRAALAVLRV